MDDPEPHGTDETGPHGPDDLESPGIDVPDLSPAEARERRESIPDEQRERVERTVSELLDLLGKAHTMAVLREFAFTEDPLRFSDLEEMLGISPNTLSERLRELTDAGLLARESYDEIPPRVEYRPTEKAEALFPAFGHFHRWACEYGLEPGDNADTSEAEVD